jgi:hypothetical protein
MMSHNEYMQQMNELQTEIDRCRAMLDAVSRATEEQCPSDRKKIYLQYHGCRMYELETKAAELKQSYYGTVAVDTFFRH